MRRLWGRPNQAHLDPNGRGKFKLAKVGYPDGVPVRRADCTCSHCGSVSRPPSVGQEANAARGHDPSHVEHGGPRRGRWRQRSARREQGPEATSTRGRRAAGTAPAEVRVHRRTDRRRHAEQLVLGREGRAKGFFLGCSNENDLG